MEQTVRVSRLLPDGRAEVIRLRESVCSGDCHQCAGCGAARQLLALTAENPVGAQPGDLVVLESKSAPVLKAAALLYLLPLLLLLAGYLLGEHLWHKGILLSLCAFFLGWIPVKCFDRHLAKKKILHTITGFAGASPRNPKE